MNIKRCLNRTLLAATLLASVLLPKLAYCTASPEAAPGAGADAASQEYSPEAREYHLKAAFLRYVAKFVEWPAQSLSPGAINICVLGLVPSFDALNSINGKVINDRTINITKVVNASEAKGHCQILFVTKTEDEHIPDILKVTQGIPVLSYGDMEDFAEKGGCMSFYIMNNRLAININPPAVEKAQLKIDPRMMRLVTVVPPIH